MVIRTDIFIVPILHAKTSRDRSQLYEPEALIEMSCVNIALNYCIELKYPEAQLFSLFKAVYNKLLTYMLSASL